MWTLAPDGHVVHQLNQFFGQKHEGVQVQYIMIKDKEAANQNWEDQGEFRGHGKGWSGLVRICKACVNTWTCGTRGVG